MPKLSFAHNLKVIEKKLRRQRNKKEEENTMSQRFFFTLLALLFCLSLEPVITSAAKSDPTRYITYDALRYNGQYPTKGSIIYGHRRLLHLHSHSQSRPSTAAGILIKTACRDNILDYLGTLCSTLLRSAPINHQHDAKTLALFALQETGKLIANASVQVKQGLVAHGHGMPVDLSFAFKACKDTWYPQARHDINRAIIQLTAKGANAKFYLVDAINGASTGVRTCYYDLAGKKFLKGESRVLVNEINGHNQFLKRMLAATQNLVTAANLEV